MQVHRIAAFTENGTGGNPAGVVLSETLPDPETMQRIAAEIGYSETVFVAPRGETWLTRYFSPETEVPFCGHATIALGAVLAEEKGPGRYHLSLSGGDIEVEAKMNDGVGYSTLRSLPTRNAPPPNTVVEEALTLFDYPRSALDPGLPPRLIHAGADHLFLALHSRDLLSAMHYDLEAGREFMLRHGLITVALVWRETDDLFHARNAFASGGVLEDPATGAAAAAIAGMLRDQGIRAGCELTLIQGVDMGRPSRIAVRYGDPVGSPVFVSGASARIA